MPKGVYKKTEEHKRRLSEARKGKSNGPCSEETRAKLSASWTPERKTAQSERQRGHECYRSFYPEQVKKVYR